MTARRALRVALLAAASVGAGFAGCKEKESLVIVTLTTAAGDPTLDTATISVGTKSQSFSLRPAGIPAVGVSFGVYVPASLKGPQTISVVASPAQAGNCNGQTGSGSVDIAAVGETYGPVLIPLSPSTAACPGTGGTNGSGGRAATGGTIGAGTGGSGGRAATGGAPGSGGSGVAGSGGGVAGTGGSGGRAATGGAPGTGGSAPPKGISACFEYDHSAIGTCNASCKDGASIYGAAFSPKNPNLAVTSGTDGNTKVWTVSNNGTMTAEGHVLSGGADGLVSFSPDGTLLAIGLDGGVQIVSTSTWAVVRTLTVANIVYGVSFTPDGTQIVTLTTDSGTTPTTSHLYLHTGANITASQTVGLTAGWAMSVSPSTVAGALPVAIATTTGSVLVYNLTAAGFGAPATVPVTSDQSAVQMAQFSPSGALLAAGGDDGYLRFWSIPLTGAAQSTTVGVYGITNAKSGVVDAVAFSPDGGELAVGAGSAGSVTTFATGTRTQVGIEQDTSSGADVTALGYSPDGKWIIGGEYSCGCVFICKH